MREREDVRERMVRRMGKEDGDRWMKRKKRAGQRCIMCGE